MNNNYKNKIFSLTDLKEKVEYLKSLNKKVGFTNGCFDIIHIGHIKLLQRASELCDKVIVGINSDDSASRVKGGSRPVVNQSERAKILASIQYVDYVVIFDHDTPLHLITQLLPDVLIKGADWQKKDIVGADIVEENGGRIINDIYIEGKSSSNIISRIKNSEG